jgi:hypothetical protein
MRMTVLAVAAALAVGSLAINPAPAAAAGMKVVIVVGPVESSTANYIANARRYAAQARSYGAAVVELYSPNATWTRVRNATKGANVLIYLGHGNGYPSPYGAFSVYSKDGMGLNATAGHGNSNVKYFGEYYVRNYINLAPNSVVILNRLCYASGDSEWGRANPTTAVAKRRADNFAAGFLRANAKAVFAIGISSASYTLKSLLTSTQSIGQIFTSDPARNLHYDLAFASIRTPGARVWMDPYAPSRYYRSVVGQLGMLATALRGG